MRQKIRNQTDPRRLVWEQGDAWWSRQESFDLGKRLTSHALAHVRQVPSRHLGSVGLALGLAQRLDFWRI